MAGRADRALGRVVAANSARLAVAAVDADAPNPRPTGALGWVGALRGEHPAIRDEWDRFVAGGGCLPHLSDLLDEDQGADGPWRAGLLVSRGGPVRPVADRFPSTLAALSRVPGLWSALWSVLEPGTELPAHRGPNAGVLRVHLGVRCEGDTALSVAGQVVPFRDGEVIVFDDTEEHAAWNRSSTPRTTLFCEILRPAQGTAGAANRLVQRLLALDRRYRRAPRRAQEWDIALNGTPRPQPTGV